MATQIIVTIGPGAKSGVDKTTVAVKGVAPLGQARHYTDLTRIAQRIVELKTLYPGIPIVRRTR